MTTTYPSTKKNLEKLAEIITDETHIDHYIEYQSHLFNLIRGDKKKQLCDLRVHSALSKAELYFAMCTYMAGYRLGKDSD